MIQALRWELSSEMMPEEVAVCLSPQEKRFKDDYNELLRQYMNEVDLDLTLVRIPPPTFSTNFLVSEAHINHESSSFASRTSMRHHLNSISRHSCYRTMEQLQQRMDL